MTSRLDEVFEGLPTLLDVPATAELLGMSKKAVYSWLKDARLPGYKVNGTWVVVRDELKEKISEGSNQLPEPPQA